MQFGSTHGTPGPLLFGSETRNVIQVTIIGGWHSLKARFSMSEKALLYTLILLMVYIALYSGLPNSDSVTALLLPILQTSEP